MDVKSLTQSKSAQLAIIIPYYKNRYIAETLSAIEKQTDKRFRVYIGDDNSPYPIQSVLDSLSEDLRNQTVYHRFSTNLGSVSLTKQWERCIELSTSEPYIWLFSDDDIMPPDAVERFYKFILSCPDTDLMRFNIQIVNDDNIITRKSEPHPDFETSQSFLQRRLTGKCISAACEYIFTRKIYIDQGGVVDFPLGWASDDATWILFSQHKGIHTIFGKPVSWRMGGFNISSDSSKTYKLKIQACISFLKFVENLYTIEPKMKINWLFGQLSLLNRNLTVKHYFYSQLLGSGLFRKDFLIQYIAIRNYKIYKNKIKRRLNSISK